MEEALQQPVTNMASFPAVLITLVYPVTDVYYTVSVSLFCKLVE